ncbi:MAG: RCKP-type rubredoxin-like domain-containing protein [Zhaonellaceae bacterium]|jgi:rubrerythrin|nr:rubredoxin [Clostridia bacterium]
MAIWKCSQCGYEKEGRCKPRKCPSCEAKDSFAKKE